MLTAGWRAVPLDVVALALLPRAAVGQERPLDVPVFHSLRHTAILVYLDSNCLGKLDSRRLPCLTPALTYGQGSRTRGQSGSSGQLGQVCGGAPVDFGDRVGVVPQRGRA